MMVVVNSTYTKSHERVRHYFGGEQRWCSQNLNTNYHLHISGYIEGSEYYLASMWIGSMVSIDTPLLRMCQKFVHIIPIALTQLRVNTEWRSFIKLYIVIGVITLLLQQNAHMTYIDVTYSNFTCLAKFIVKHITFLNSTVPNYIHSSTMHLSC